MERVEEASSESENHQFYPVGPRLIMVTISLMLAVFCVALDNTVSFMIGTIPSAPV